MPQRKPSILYACPCSAYIILIRSFIEVHGRPGAPVFTLGPRAGQAEEEEVESGTFTLHWTTISNYPLLEYRILFKKVMCPCTM